jgi:hypothetical protein
MAGPEAHRFETIPERLSGAPTGQPGSPAALPASHARRRAE